MSWPRCREVGRGADWAGCAGTAACRQLAAEVESLRANLEAARSGCAQLNARLMELR